MQQLNSKLESIALNHAEPLNIREAELHQVEITHSIYEVENIKHIIRQAKVKGSMKIKEFLYYTI